MADKINRELNDENMMLSLGGMEKRKIKGNHLFDFGSTVKYNGMLAVVEEYYLDTLGEGGWKYNIRMVKSPGTPFHKVNEKDLTSA